VRGLGVLNIRSIFGETAVRPRKALRLIVHLEFPADGRYEERDYVATGSGMLHAGTVIKLGWRDNLDRTAAITLACRGLWEAADADSATGGPDPLRGIYPVIASITASGWERVPDPELVAIFESIAAEVRNR